MPVDRVLILPFSVSRDQPIIEPFGFLEVYACGTQSTTRELFYTVRAKFARVVS